MFVEIGAPTIEEKHLSALLKWTAEFDMKRSRNSVSSRKSSL